MQLRVTCILLGHHYMLAKINKNYEECDTDIDYLQFTYLLQRRSQGFSDM